MPYPHDEIAGISVKIDRAKRHIAELKHGTGTFINNNPYTVAIETDAATGDKLYRVRVHHAVPPDFSGIIGDVIHNSRSALDLLACAFVVAEGGKPTSKTRFPISNTKSGFLNKGLALLDGAHGSAIRIIKLLRPYQGGSLVLWQLHQLDILDKHKAIIPSGGAFYSIVKFFGPPFTRADGSPIGLEIKAAKPLFPIENDQIIFRLQARPDSPSTPGILAAGPAVYATFPGGTQRTLAAEEEMHRYKFNFTIFFGDGQILPGEPVIATLEKFVGFVERLVKLCVERVPGLFPPKVYDVAEQAANPDT